MDGCRLQRSGHAAFVHNNTLYVCGGYQAADGQDVMLSPGQMWMYDLHSGIWRCKTIPGEIPADLSGFCGSNISSRFYIFGGFSPSGYSNQMFSVDVSEPCCFWKKVTDTAGKTPSPRNKHSCWAHRDRLIYFGGYGCKTIGEVQSAASSSFVLEEMSWTTIGDNLFRCWGWNNEVNVFDTHTATWSMPETRGSAPVPRDSHASALLGNKGFISGGAETPALDIFCLDFDTWTWTQFDVCSPPGRSMHTMTSTSDHTLLIFGGFGVDGNTLSDVWLFDTTKSEWTETMHRHRNKPRVGHSACLGNHGDVVVFGGSSKLCIRMDSLAVLRSPSQHHCKDVLIFQTRPYSLYRLCEDFIGANVNLFRRQIDWLPAKLRHKVEDRSSFF